MKKTAIVIGNSDGIGLNLSKALLKQGWNLIGLSRSPSPIQNVSYKHILINVESQEYSNNLEAQVNMCASIDLCVYCAGIGEKLYFFLTAGLEPE
ncbi:MAG: SDR family NAD(P)-dependent oxidoreductase [bacterium]|nr:SDR family NAD(P)-dependent oxidoreductase [bacterium]